jgi:hypothetical protein
MSARQGILAAFDRTRSAIAATAANRTTQEMTMATDDTPRNDPNSTISVYLEPTKRKVKIDLRGEATVGDIVEGLVAHLSTAEGFDVQRYLRDKIGDGFSPEWQLFRERANMQLLPPGARFGELEPPLDTEEMFTMKVNAKVA